MATPLLTRSPTCLRCLRRSLGSGGVGNLPATAIAVSRTQVRGKKGGRPRDHGVVVRLLEDIPAFGRKDAVVRTDRGRMRNLWYPNKRAEYMTAARFAEMGLHHSGTYERDPFFGVSIASDEGEQGEEADEAEEERRRVQVQTVAPERAVALLEALLPEVLVFSRKTIVAQDAPAPLSPVSMGGSGGSAALFGSVSAEDVAAEIRSLLSGDAEAGLVRVDARDIKWVGVADGADRIKTLGRWDIEIAVRDAPGDSVRKAVVVVAQE